MTPAQFAFLAKFLKDRSGLVIGEDKRYLVEARLGPVAHQRGLASLSDLAAALARGADLDLAARVVEAMTTNETFFFRDGAPFTLFTDVMLPHLMAARAREKTLRIWSAACSSGQEPYSLAMLLAERKAQLAGWRVEIVATDLAGEVVERAKEGLFSQFEVQRGLPIKLLLKHFAQEGERWRIDAALRQMVHFRTLNLLRDFSALGRFDVVFCRNVLIYFDAETKADVLNRIAASMAPDGYLMVGSAEAPEAITRRFRAHPSRGGLLVKGEGAASAAPALSLVAAR
ncbi:CheR family methyltransferase [Chenggangzhangella methanolivorans]|uniref:protein-glutamate O-methyltransferase n=1 Tax=Chenggangzhangella methanolivorans TaxID=1437009 RepID=A0A9E6R9F4_9HYPH|nr:CheR family methyltransferase [Chenggangzhangella methanolivorans]QZN99258.1 chemotaxis protein CheR [Chenggangzhangella methanolivorans]